MSVLKVYLNWANSILSEVGKSVEGVADIQKGKSLCELLDILTTDANLINKVQTSGCTDARTYLKTALEHMRLHGIKFAFTVQDLLDGDIKSLLDVLWLVILNYGIHNIDQNTFQRSVGIGKKNLLDWCQHEVDAIFDPRNTLSFNLCTGNWFTRLLHKFSGENRTEDEDRADFLEKLLHKIQDKYAISEDIVSASDIVDGTVDEHSLMIYLSLLNRRVGGKINNRSNSISYKLTLPAGGLNLNVISPTKRSRSASPLVTRSSLQEEGDKYCSDSELFSRLGEQSRSPHYHKHTQQKASRENPSDISRTDQTSMMSRSHESMEQSTTNQTAAMSAARSHESVEDGSDWFSSTSGSLMSSPVGRLSPSKDGRVTPLDPGRVTPIDPGREQVVKDTISEQVWKHMSQSEVGEERETSQSLIMGGQLGEVEERLVSGSGTDTSEKPVNRVSGVDSKAGETNGGSDIKIRRPKDYFRQWEDTIDRLSHGPVSSDLDSSRSSSRSRSRSHESNCVQGDNSLERKSEFDSFRSLSNSPSRRVYSRSPSYTYREHLPHRKSSPSPQRHTALTAPLSAKQRAQSAYSPQRGLKSEREEAEAGMSAYGELNHDQQLLDLQHLLTGTDLNVLASSFKPGEKVEVLVLFEALRKARQAVDNNMPMDDFRSRRLQQRKDLSETNLKHVESSVDSSSVSSIPKPDELNSVYEHSSATHQQSGMRVHSPGRDIRDVERERSPSAVVGLSRRHPSMSPRRTPQRMQREPIRNEQTADKEPIGDEHKDDKEPIRDEGDKELDERRNLTNGGLEGGYGRVPRREAWERQQHSDVHIDASRMDSLAQGKFVEVLCKEIEDLKHKVEEMERPRQMVYNPSKVTGTARHQQRSYYGDIDRIENPFGLQTDVHDQNGRMLFETSRSRSASPRYSLNTGSALRPDTLSSERYQERLGRSLNVDSHEALRSPDQPRSRSLSPHLERQSVRRDSVLSHSHLETEQNRNKPYESRYTSSRFTHSYHVDTPRSGRPLISLYSSSSTPNLSRQPVTLSSSSPRDLSRQPVSLSSSSPRDLSRQPVSLSSSSPRDLSRQSVSLSNSSPQDLSRPPVSLSNSSPRDLSRQPVSLSSSSPRDLSRQAISLGYSSPVRSVTQEIWGNNLNQVEALESGNQGRWKQLIANRNLSNEDVIELKQALASSIVENDILQAKLNNAKSEVSEKLYHTNGVLDDCRKHLAKSQAENMELRSGLEHERQQTEDLEVRVKELEDSLYESNTQLSQLEGELEQTRGELNQTLNDQPTLEQVRKQNQLINTDLNRTESVNSSLKQEVEELKLTQEKAQTTIRDLRTCLEEVRQERSQLFEEVMCLQLASDGQKVKVQSIIHRYSDKESKEAMNGRLQDLSFTQSPSNRRHTRRPEVAVSPIRIHSQSTPKHHQRTSTLDDETTKLNGKLDGELDGSLNLSGIPASSGSPNLNNCSPRVPSSYREIYPHRKSRYYNEKSALIFSLYPELQQNPTHLSYPQYPSEDDSTRDLSQSNMIRRKLRYSPVQDDCDGNTWLMSCEDFSHPSVVDTVVESPVQARHSPTRLSPARHSPGRLSQSLHQSSTPSRIEQRNHDRLNMSHNAVYDIAHARSNSSGLLVSRRGILKNGNFLYGRHIRERSCSPILQRNNTPHSPPTRLSPRSRSPVSSRQWSGRSSSLERNIHAESSSPQISAIKRKAWYELQINDGDNNRNKFEAEMADQLLQQPAMLNDEQRRYADHLIEKYTGLPIPQCSIII